MKQAMSLQGLCFGLGIIAAMAVTYVGILYIIYYADHYGLYATPCCRKSFSCCIVGVEDENTWLWQITWPTVAMPLAMTQVNKHGLSARCLVATMGPAAIAVWTHVLLYMLVDGYLMMTVGCHVMWYWLAFKASMWGAYWLAMW